MNPAVLLFAALTLSLLSLPGQDGITLAEGSSSTALSIRVLDEANPAATGKVFLSQLEFLPIEITNRKAQDSLRSDRSRLVERQGIRRVELPTGGRIFQYRLQGGLRYGYLLVGPDGRPTILHQLAGIGVGGKESPYADRLGVAADGRHAGIVTKAGGLFLARLDGLVYQSSRASARPLKLPAGVGAEPFSITPGQTHLFFLTENDRAWRCALGDSSQPVDMTPPGQTGWITKKEMALSGDGKSVVFLFGLKKLLSLYWLGSTGAARRLPPKASKYERPGYLPESQGGPFLMLNHDGSRLMYIDASLRDEIFLLDTTSATSTVHITSDLNFQPYIGIGILPVFVSQTLMVAIGDIGAFDWFQTGTKTGKVLNLTRSGPAATPPYAAGKLLPVASHLTPSGMLIAPEKEKSGRTVVRTIDTKTQNTSATAGAMRAGLQVGNSLSGHASILLPGFSGDLVVDGGTALPLLASPPSVHLSPEVIWTSGLFALSIASDGSSAAGPRLAVLRISGGPVLVLGPVAGLRQVALTRSGGALFNGNGLRYLAVGKDLIIPCKSPFCTVLSGAGN